MGMPLQQVGRSFWDQCIVPRLSGVFLLHAFVLSDPQSGFVPWASQNKQCSSSLIIIMIKEGRKPSTFILCVRCPSVRYENAYMV